jgi:kynurenine formamidase
MKLSFSSNGEDVARLLVEQIGVAVLGVDTASIDFGPSSGLLVHRVATARNVAGLENRISLYSLPKVSFYVVALPLKIEGGPEGSVRVVATVPR